MRAPDSVVTTEEDGVLRVRIHLSELRRGADVDLQLSPCKLVLIAANAQYHLELDLPERARDEEAVAKYDKKSRTLTVTIPLAPTVAGADALSINSSAPSVAWNAGAGADHTRSPDLVQEARAAHAAAVVERDAAAAAAVAAFAKAAQAGRAALEADTETVEKAAAMRRATERVATARAAVQAAIDDESRAALELERSKAACSVASEVAAAARAQAAKATEAATRAAEFAESLAEPRASGEQHEPAAAVPAAGVSLATPAEAAAPVSDCTLASTRRAELRSAEAESAMGRALPDWVTWRQDEKEVAFILEKPAILEQTVEIEVKPSTLRISFSAGADHSCGAASNHKEGEAAGAACTRHAVVIPLTGEVDTAQVRKHVADLNMMLVLTKARQEIWDDLQPPAALPGHPTKEMYELD
jgi:HSP20 family molecular chaperone IbpA